MGTPNTQSGWLIERPGGGFVAVGTSPVASGPYALFHALHGPEGWGKAECFGFDRFPGPYAGAALLASADGALYCVASGADGAVAHMELRDGEGWQPVRPGVLPLRAAGPPAFVQGRSGAFEVVVPGAGRGLRHLRRDGGDAWAKAKQPAASGKWSGLGLIHSGFGNLEAAGVRNGQLVFLWQDGEGGPWSDPLPLDPDAEYVGRPALIQGRMGRIGNFEVIACRRDGTLVHLWRDNDAAGFPWSAPAPLAPATGEATLSDVALVHAEDGAFVVLARAADEARTFQFRTMPGQPWPDPVPGPVFR